MTTTTDTTLVQTFIVMSVSEGNPDDTRRLVVTVADHGLSVLAQKDGRPVADYFITPEALWDKVTR